MTKLLSTISRALTRTPDAESAVHFHHGPNGVYVCEYAACDSPGADPGQR